MDDNFTKTRDAIDMLENLNISKNHVNDILSAVADYWRKDAWANKSKLALISFAKLAVATNSDQTISEYYKAIIHVSRALETLNGLERLKQEAKTKTDKEFTDHLVERLVEQIKSGDIFAKA